MWSSEWLPPIHGRPRLTNDNIAILQPGHHRRRMVGSRCPDGKEARTCCPRSVWECYPRIIPHPDLCIYLCSEREFGRGPSEQNWRTRLKIPSRCGAMPQIFACFNELEFNTQPRMNKVIAVSIGSAAITYEVVSCVSGVTSRAVETRLMQSFPL